MPAKPQYRLTAAELEIVLAVVRGGTLADAGLRLGVDGSTVFRTVQRIESGLGQRLFERSRNGYQATEIGNQIAAHAERIETELEGARSAAHARSDAVAGRVSITTTDTFLKALVLPAISELSRLHPLLEFELTTTNQVASLTKRDADIAVRATKRPPDHLVGKRVGRIRYAVFGPTHVGGRGVDTNAVGEAAWVAADDALPAHPTVKWRRKDFPKINPRFKVNSIVAVVDGIAAGLGVGAIPLFLAEGRADLRQLTGPIEDCDSELWVLTHPESRHLRRIATAYRYLSESLRLE